MYHLDRFVVDERTFGILAALAAVCVVCLRVCICVWLCVCLLACCDPYVYCGLYILCKEACRCIEYSEFRAVSPRKCDTTGDCRWSTVVAAFWDALATIWFWSELQVDKK